MNMYLFYLGLQKKFLKKNKKKNKILDLESAARISNRLICGTSGKSKIEVKAIDKFKKKNYETIAIVEHWTNYKIRFKLKKKLILPDKIWVFDKHAKEKMKSTIKTKIIIKKNYYLSDIKKKIKKIKKSSNNLNILYVSEPVSEIKKNTVANYKKSKEYKSIKYFNDNINAITKKISDLFLDYILLKKLANING